MCDLESIGSSSMLRFIRSVAVLVRMLMTLDLNRIKNELGVECHTVVVEVILICFVQSQLLNQQKKRSVSR